ncbi:MAG: sulfite exporter TauE/SafE family protein [Planctomycetota bacterium]
MTDSPAPAPSPLGRSITWLVAFVVWALWAWAMQDGNRWGLFRTEYYMSITMVFGAFIAGATSEGGGAVAFPVMTLIFAIQPVVARDFSLMIQSVGMGAAALTILMGGIPIERRAAVWASLGGAIGVLIGIEYVAPLLQPKFAKMTFLSIWLSFAFALYWINRHQDREVRESIEHFGARHGVLLVGTGLIGGIVSGITGSGLDILTFSLLVLRFRIASASRPPLRWC